jgi:hypothetical protein
MKIIPCRDCGEMIDVDGRGCPTCARNLEAERMLARYFWRASALVTGICAILLSFLLANR